MASAEDNPNKGESDRQPPSFVSPPRFEDAAPLGLAALSAIVAGAGDGITLVDTDRRFVYVNPAGCQMFGHPLEALVGRDFLDSVPVSERAIRLARFGEQLADAPVESTGLLIGPGGEEREIVMSSFGIEIDGRRHGAGIIRDLTESRAASRAAVSLAQTAAALVDADGRNEMLDGIGRHAVEGTRALACGITAVGQDHDLLAFGGGYGPGFGLEPAGGNPRSPGWMALTAASGAEVIRAMTAGAIVVGSAPGKPVVNTEARTGWQVDPTIKTFASLLTGMDWQTGVSVPLSWGNRVFGLLYVFLPSAMTRPSEVELAFYTALADQAAVSVMNGVLAAGANKAAAVLERTHLARDLHDSVSQALFSMTMHGRAAQLAMEKAGLEDTPGLGRAIAQLSELTRGALAEMRALIFELRPGALAEEGLVVALGKQTSAVTAREEVTVTLAAPDEHLHLADEEEEHLYRIVSEALHNVVKHAEARTAVISITEQPSSLRVAINDDGAGFDPACTSVGSMGLTTMAERASTIGAELVISSTLGEGTSVVVTLPRSEELDEGGADGR